MLPDRVSNPGPLTYESGALPIALCGPAKYMYVYTYVIHDYLSLNIVVPYCTQNSQNSIRVFFS